MKAGGSSSGVNFEKVKELRLPQGDLYIYARARACGNEMRLLMFARLDSPV